MRGLFKDEVEFQFLCQVSIKMGKFEAAIDDCDFAFRIDEKCLKAFVHKAKALAMLNKFKEARSILDEALDLNPQSKKTVAEYMQLVDELDKSHELKVKVQEVIFKFHKRKLVETIVKYLKLYSCIVNHRNREMNDQNILELQLGDHCFLAVISCKSGFM